MRGRLDRREAGRPPPPSRRAGRPLRLRPRCLAGSPDAGVNPRLRDVDLGGVDPVATCGDSAADMEAAHFAHVESGGECWQHVHPDTLSVFDFSLWQRSPAAGELFGTDSVLVWVGTAAHTPTLICTRFKLSQRMA